ncbi:MAG: hypothetical protein AAB877_01735 [Patescibacteria group bacterium]
MLSQVTESTNSIVVNNTVNTQITNSIIIPLIIGIVGYFLTERYLGPFLKSPSFRLNLDFIPQRRLENGISLPVLDITVINKKRWIGYGSGDVNFGIFVPVLFMREKKFKLITFSGHPDWSINTLGKDMFLIEDVEYFLFRGVIQLAVHPNSNVHFLRLVGDFKNGEKAKIFYYFETPYGKFPRKLKYGNKVNLAKQGRLPYENITIPLN